MLPASNRRARPSMPSLARTMILAATVLSMAVASPASSVNNDSSLSRSVQDLHGSGVIFAKVGGQPGIFESAGRRASNAFHKAAEAGFQPRAGRRIDPPGSVENPVPDTTNQVPKIVHLAPTDDVAAIVSASPEGTTFVLGAGIYHNLTITPKSHQTFIGLDGAVLDGSIEITGWQQSGDVWSAGYPEPGWSHGEGRDGMAQYTEDLLIDGQPLVRVASMAELSESTFYYENGTVFTLADPTGKTTRALSTPVAFVGGDTTGATIVNLTITNYASPAQRGAINAHETSNWTLSDLVVTGNHGAGVAAGDGMLIHGGSYSNNGQVGIHAYDTTGLVIDGVVASGNNYAGFSETWDAGGIKILTSDHVIVRNSDIGNNMGIGLWLDWDNKDVIIENNYIHYNKYLGLFYEASYDAVMRGNTVVNNNQNHYAVGYWGSDVFVTSSSNVTIIDNIVWSEIGQGIGLEQSPREPGVYGTHVMANNTVTGNTIVMPAGGGNGVSGPTTGNVWDQNIYYLSREGSTWFTWDHKFLTPENFAAAGMDGQSQVIYPSDFGALMATLVGSPLHAAIPTPGPTVFQAGVDDTLQGNVAGIDGGRVYLLSQAAYGTIQMSGDGSFAYEPGKGFAGIDEFRYVTIGADGSATFGRSEVSIIYDEIVIRVAGDAWQGNPEFHVAVDGEIQAGVFTATASHRDGLWQDVVVRGDFGFERPESVSVAFINDGYGGAANLDRNLYVRSVSIEGETYDAGLANSSAGWTQNNVAPLVINGTVTFETDAAADILVLSVSGDHFKGSPEFDVRVNGKLAQGFIVTANHASGEWQEVIIRGDLDIEHGSEVAISFLNDAWQGTGKDRNLYIHSVSLNGDDMRAAETGSAEFLHDGTFLLPRNDTLYFEL